MDLPVTLKRKYPSPRRAISLCTGDIIFLADQDDVWHREKIEKLTEIFIQRPEVGAVFTNAEVVDQNLRPVGAKLWDVTFPKAMRKDARENGLFDVMLWQNVVTGATMAFRADLRENFLPIPDDIPNIIHDGWIALIASAISVVEFVDEPLIDYRQHESQQLGLGLNAKGSVNEEYERSITVLEREKVRLAKLGEFLKTDAALSKRTPRESIKELIERKDKPLQHYKTRMSLSDSRVLRIVPVVNELLTGRYHAVSKGFTSAIKDLLKQS
jgi:hypothetical protein